MPPRFHSQFEEVQRALMPGFLSGRDGQRSPLPDWPHAPHTAVPEQQLALDRLAWLLEGSPSGASAASAGDLPPVDVLLEHCLRPLVNKRVSEIY